MPTELGNPVEWSRSANWEIGNYALKNIGFDEIFFTGGPPSTTKERARYIENQPNATSGPTSTNSADSLVFVISPDVSHPREVTCIDIDGDLATANNYISMPSPLKDDFTKNNFGWDVDRSSVVTFPGLSTESQSLLAQCSLRMANPESAKFLLNHFRVCLQVHCLYGDVHNEYGPTSITNRLDLWAEGVPDDDKDTLDVAIRASRISMGLLAAQEASNDSSSETVVY
ncbi:hypothetical protein BDZ89DRAFT_1133298 [Hymenopellis radicata]|nr:hypothetical protein BDZ89DRAFT_1133298 [Hymenopellis radicata]